jgi:integrase
MGRKRTGAKFFDKRTQRWFVVLTVDLKAGGTERWPIQLPSGTTEEEAERQRVGMAESANGKVFESRKRRRNSTADNLLTVEQYATERWLESRARRGLRSVAKDRQRLKKYVLPAMGDKLMTKVSKDDVRALVERLDTLIHTRKLGWRTAQFVWRTVTKMFKDSVASKQELLRVREVNPCADVTGPDRGHDKAKQWLYPAEFVKLIQCADVPLHWRQTYAATIYLYLRLSEIRALDVSDVDLEHNMVIVHRSTNETGTEVREFTKTSSVRQFRIEPEIVPVLKAMTGERTSGRLLSHTVDDAPASLRKHLTLAGVARAALHNETETSLPIRFHDLRASGITWAALRGDSTIAIRDRAGHTDVEQTNDYIRRASAAGDVGQPFPSLAGLAVSVSEVSVGKPASKKKRYQRPNRIGELARPTIGFSEYPSGSEGSPMPAFSGGGHDAKPAAGAQTSALADDIEFTAEDFAAALAESSDRGAVAELLAKPLTKTKPSPRMGRAKGAHRG